MQNRRNFLKNSLIGSMGIGSLMSSSAKAAEVHPKGWDKISDVVVIGLGAAGLTTAISAAQNGCSVTIIERQPAETVRPNTRMSGGMFHTASKDGDKAALKEYAKAMFSGENIPWKKEGEEPVFSDELAQHWADYLPTLIDFMQSLDPDF